MHLHSKRAALTAACGLLAVCLAIPAAASAHEINASKSSASCALVDGTPTVTFTLRFESFADANKPVSGTIKLDGAVVKTTLMHARECEAVERGAPAVELELRVRSRPLEA